MQKVYFSTKRLTCRPLEQCDICSLQEIVEEPMVQKYFRIENAADLLDSFREVECFPVGVFNKSDSQLCRRLLGYINSYVYNREELELLVEFFLKDSFYCVTYVWELLNEYISKMRKLHFETFRFDVDEDDTDLAFFLTNFGARHYEEEDFVDTTNGKERRIHVYKL